MDKVRFGRALGKGTRAAAKSLWEAADAAAAPDPSARAQTVASAQTTPRSSANAAPRVQDHAATQAARGTESVRQSRRQAQRAARVGGRSIVAPVKKFSSVLWLEITGSFFALIALFLAQGAWKLHLAVHASAPAAHKLEAYLALCALFAYFAVSSFVRAHRRGKKQ